MNERKNSPLWFAYKAERARAKADALNAEADEYERRYDELMAAADKRAAVKLKELREVSGRVS